MKILVVDDEVLARERLLRLLARLEPDATCVQASDGEQALAMVASQNPDLLLLDIRMPGMDGMEVASRLDTLSSPPAVIFCTAYDEYAMEALRHQAMAYLLKPVRETELAQALSTAGRINRVQLAQLQEVERSQGSDGSPRRMVSSETHRGFESVPVVDVCCFLAEQKYVTAVSGGGELLIPDTLKDLEEELGDRFIRVHRNALVALDHIVRLEREEGAWRVILRDIDVVPAVSRRHLAAVKKRLAER